MMGLLMAGARQTGDSVPVPMTMIAPEPPTFSSRAPQARAPRVEIEDLDILLAAVKERLGRLVASAGRAPDSAAAIGADVLDCANALEQVEASLRQEITRCRQLEHALFDARSDLAKLRAILRSSTPRMLPPDGAGKQ